MGTYIRALYWSFERHVAYIYRLFLILQCNVINTLIDYCFKATVGKCVNVTNY